MVLFIIAIGFVLISVLPLALPLLREAKHALPTGSPQAIRINGREIDGSLSDRRIEELIREELYGRRLNVSRSVATGLRR